MNHINNIFQDLPFTNAPRKSQRFTNNFNPYKKGVKLILLCLPYYVLSKYFIKVYKKKSNFLNTPT